MKVLTDLTATLFARIREHTDRPEALDALNRMINSSEYFLAKARCQSYETCFDLSPTLRHIKLVFVLGKNFQRNLILIDLANLSTY